MLQNIFVYWLGLLPLIVFNNHFEVPKVSIFLVGGFFLSVFWIFRTFTQHKENLVTKKDVWFLLWILTLLAAGAFGSDSVKSLLGGSYRHQGVIFFFTLFLVGKTISILSPEKKTYLKKVMAGTILIESLIVVLQIITGNTYFGRPLGTLGEVNAVAGYLAFGTYFISQTLPKLFVFIMSIPIVIIFSRSGVLSYAIFVFINFFKILKPKLLVILVTVAIYFVLVISTQKGNSVFESRTLIWKMATEAIYEKPLLGYGAESQEKIYKQSFKRYEIALKDLMIDRSHNLFLDVTIWSGLLGLTFFVGWLFLEYKDLKDMAKKAAFFAFLIYSFFQPLSVVHWTFLVLLFNI